MSNLMIACMATLAYFICYGGNWLFGQCMIERPIVVGTITGLFLGDLTTGIIIGGALEAIYMGAVNIGGATSAEPVSATVMSVTFAITAGLSMEEAITLAVPVGLIFNSLSMVWIMLTNIFQPAYQKVCDHTIGMQGLEHESILDKRGSTIYFTRDSLSLCCVYLGLGVSSSARLYSVQAPDSVSIHGLARCGRYAGGCSVWLCLMKMLVSTPC